MRFRGMQTLVHLVACSWRHHLREWEAVHLAVTLISNRGSTHLHIYRRIRQPVCWEILDGEAKEDLD